MILGDSGSGCGIGSRFAEALALVSSADPEAGGPNDEPSDGIPVRPGAPHFPSEPEAYEFAEDEKHQEMGAGFGGGYADAESPAEDGSEGKDGGADPEEEYGRDFASDILGRKEMGQDGIAQKDDAIDHDVTEHNRRNGSKQLHESASGVARFVSGRATG